MIEIVCMYKKHTVFKTRSVQQIPGFQNSMWFKTKSLIGLANPLSDFLHWSRLFMDIEKM